MSECPVVDNTNNNDDDDVNIILGLHAKSDGGSGDGSGSGNSEELAEGVWLFWRRFFTVLEPRKRRHFAISLIVFSGEYYIAHSHY